MRLHRVLLSLSLGVTLLGSVLAVQAQPPENPPQRLEEEIVVFDPRGAPEGAIEHFIELCNSGQLRGLPDLIIGAEKDAAALARTLGEITKARGTLVFRVVDMQVETEQEESVVNLTVHASDHLGMGMVWREALKLRVEGGIWKLRPSDPRSLDSSFDNYLQRLITLLAYPKATAFVQGPRVSVNQVKQLVLGVKQFIQDNDEQYAFTPETVKASIQPYIRNDSLWTAPGDEPGTVSYSFNPHLANVNEANIEFIAETVLFYLGRDEKLDFRYDGKTVVGFTDGYVELLTEEQAKKLRWEP